MTEYIPPKIIEWQDRLETDTGVRPTVRKYINGYLLEHVNEQVQMTIHFKRVKGGRMWGNTGSTLTIGGVRQKLLANDWNDYVQIFKDGRRKTVEDMPLFEMPESEWDVDEDDLPEKVIKDVDGLLVAARRANPKSRIVVTYGGDEAEYIVRLETDQVYMLARYSPCGDESHHGHYELAPDGFRVVLREAMRDISDLIGGAGPQLAAILAGQMDNGDPGTPMTLGHAHQAARTNSVEIRRATVIRN